jgi:hypothetical protein
MKQFILSLALGLVLQLHAQVIDSLIVRSDLFAVVSGDYSHKFINLHDNGFLVYGGVAKPKKKGIAGVTTTFKINQYDTAFKFTETVIEMPQKVGPTSVYQSEAFVYFIVEPQLSGTGVAYLIKYNVRDRTYTRFTLYNNWKSSRNLSFVVVGEYLYVKYERAENGGYGVLVYRPYLEVYNLTQEKIKDVDLTIKEFAGYELASIEIVDLQNSSDTVYAIFGYNGDGKKFTPSNRASRIQGFYNGRMIMDGVDGSGIANLTGTHSINCGDKVNFWTIYPNQDSMYVSLSFLTSSAFVKSGNPEESACFPGNLYRGWSFQYPNQSSFVDIDQELDGEDFLKGKFDKPIRFTKVLAGKKVLDTTSMVFKESERTVLPSPYRIVVNESADLCSEFIISSWQRLYSFRIGSDNKLVQNYSIHLPPHQQEGIEAPPLYPASWEAFRNRSLLQRSFDIQYAYSEFYYFISLIENPGYGGFTMKLYKCRF